MIKLKNRLNKTIIPFLLFVFVFGIYLYTAPRYQTGYADSEELMAAAYTWGVSHPPGYPLFPLLSRPFLWLPFGTIAFRFSVFSSFFGALTIVLVYLFLQKLLEKKQGLDSFPKKITSPYLATIASLVGALSLAFSYTFWLYSIVPEVFCLANFFVALLFYVSISWYQAKKQGKDEFFPHLFVFVLALGFLAQQLIIVLLPALFIFVWRMDKKLLVVSKRWLGLLGALALGFLPLLYLPLAALKEPVIDSGNPVSPSLFWQHLTRQQYGEGGWTSAYVPRGIDFMARLHTQIYYLSYLLEQFSPVLVAFGFLGLLFLFVQKEKRIIGFLLLVSFFLAGPFFVFFGWWGNEFNPSFNDLGAQERTATMSCLIFSLFIGLSVFYVLKNISQLNLSSWAILVITSLFLFIPFYALQDNFSVVNKRDFYLGHDFAENLFANIEPNAILFVKGDRPTFSALYYQLVEGRRKDVTVLSFGAKAWNLERIKKEEPGLFETDNPALLAIYREVVQKNVGQRPIYITGLTKDALIQLGIAANPYAVSPRGIICQVTKEFDFGQGYFQKLTWHGPQNIGAYYDWYAKELIEQYVIGLSNNYFHYRVREHRDLAQDEYSAMLAIAPEHSMTKNVAEDFEIFSQTEIVPKQFVLGTAQDHFEIARQYLNEQKPGEAMSEYWTAVFLAPENNVYRLQLAGTYEILGWQKEAKEQYQHVLSTEKDNSTVIEKARERIEIVEYKSGN